MGPAAIKGKTIILVLLIASILIFLTVKAFQASSKEFKS